MLQHVTFYTDASNQIKLLQLVSWSQELQNTKANEIMCMIVTTDELSKSYSDQTGKFPVTSSRGNQCIFILYHYDTNSIHASPLKNRQAANITQAWLDTYALLKHHG